MNILLIGHEGYLGRGLMDFLGRGNRVIGWDKNEDLFKLDASVLASEKVDLLVNLSVAADRKNRNFQAGEPTDEINVGGARHIATILKGSSIGWIQMSTREVLGPIYTESDVVQVDGDYRPKFLVNEGAPYSPSNFYGKSKIMAEFISESHPRSSVIRLTTCYTDYDHPGGNWMVALVKAAVNGKPVSLTRGGRQFRDPLHIDDLGRLMEAIYASNAWGEKFHAGGGDANMISLLEFVLRANPDVRVEQAQGGDFGFAFDNSKASKMTGWSPRILVRERIPVLVENIRAGVSWPSGSKPGVNPQ